jgi:hypothetical protein
MNDDHPIGYLHAINEVSFLNDMQRIDNEPNQHVIAFYQEQADYLEHIMEQYDDADQDFGYPTQPAFYGDNYREAA